jgi:hypothetical protein
MLTKRWYDFQEYEEDYETYQDMVLGFCKKYANDIYEYDTIYAILMDGREE